MALRNLCCVAGFLIVAGPARAVTVTFQAGDGSGLGTTNDTILVAQNRYTDENFNGEEMLSVDQEDNDFNEREVRAILKFPEAFGPALGQVGSDATIERATITLWTEDEGSDIGVFALNESWDVNEVCWDDRSDGQAWTSEGADPPASASTPVVEFDASSEGMHVLDITALGETWAADPDSNHGVLIVAYTTNGTDFYASEWSQAQYRPLLSVDLIVGDEPNEGDEDDEDDDVSDPGDTSPNDSGTSEEWDADTAGPTDMGSEDGEDWVDLKGTGSGCGCSTTAHHPLWVGFPLLALVGLRRRTAVRRS